MKTYRVLTIALLTFGFVCIGSGQTGTKPLQYKKLKYPPLRQVQIPEPLKFQLGNGMIVYLLEDRTLPLIEGSVLVRTGSQYEPADQIGLASLTGEVMRTGGTTSKTGEQLDEMLEKAGASVETYIGTTSGGANLSVLKEDFDMGLSVLADVLKNPAFRDDKIELAKISARSEISRRNDDVGSIAGREFRRLIYGPNDPFSRMAEYATIENIEKKDLVEFHRKFYAPNNIMIALWGDFDAKEMKAKVEQAFGSWERKEVSLSKVPEPKLASEKTVNFIKKDDVNQSNIFLGHLGGVLRDPESGPLNVADQAFGGTMASRLFKKVRSEQGLAYSVGSNWGEGYDRSGVFQLRGSTKSGSTIKMVKSITSEFENFIKNGITDEELKFAKDSYLNSFVFRFDTKGKIINELMTLEYSRYPKDFIQQQQKDIQNATKQSVNDAVKKRWKPEALALLVVGKESDFDEPMSSLGMKVRTIDITIPAPPEKLPEPTPETTVKGKDILKKAAMAMGGPALLGIKDIILVGKQLQVTPMGEFAMDAEIKVVRPNKMLAHMKTPMGDMTMVFDGNNAWVKSPMGTQDLPGSQREEMVQQVYGDVYYILQIAEKGEYAFQYLKDDSIDGKAMSVVLARHAPSKFNLQLFIDSKTGLVIKKVSKQTGQKGPVTNEEVYSDYRLVDGVQFPFKTVGTSDGKKVSELTLTSVKLNAGVKEDVFKK
ncbi:MAG: insulinase family protein [Ignavibacteriales bacterium]|nr:insulinase family protein [Ignavibacteriales bacterium]